MDNGEETIVAGSIAGRGGSGFCGGGNGDGSGSVGGLTTTIFSLLFFDFFLPIDAKFSIFFGDGDWASSGEPSGEPKRRFDIFLSFLIVEKKIFSIASVVRGVNLRELLLLLQVDGGGGDVALSFIHLNKLRRDDEPAFDDLTLLLFFFFCCLQEGVKSSDVSNPSSVVVGFCLNERD